MIPDMLLAVVVCCFVCVAAQFNGIQNFQLNGGRTNIDHQRQLSPQQQGHILSDIQQHQHRFQLHQNLLKEQQKTLGFGQQNIFQFPNQQALSANQPFIGGGAVSGPDHPDSILQPQLPLLHQNHQFNSHTNGQPSLQNPQFISQQSLTSSVATPVANQFLNPTQSSISLQQGGFQNNFLQQSVRPTNNPAKVITNAPPSVSPTQGEQNNFFNQEAHEQRLKELRLKQQIIDKHNQFVEKQYEKALKKAQDEHQEWLEKQREQRKKLYQSLYRPGAPRILNYSGPRARLIFPEEQTLFQQAVDKYYQEHPTTTTTTTTTTTEKPTTKADATTRASKKLDLEDDEDPELFLPNNRQNIYSESKSSVQREVEVSAKDQFLPTAIPESKIRAKPIKSIEQLDLLQKQYQQQLLQREDLLAQLRKTIAEIPDEETKDKNFTSREINLPNGQTVQIIKTTDPKLVPGATPFTSESIASPKIVKATPTTPTTTFKPPKAFLEELTKGVLPPGADFEVIKHDPNGGLQELGKLPSNLPNEKKVTFVLLEEQQDGSYKVQGVKGNTNDQKDKESADVDSILDRIKSGELKLPPPTKSSFSNEVTSTPYSVKDIKAQSTAYPRSTISHRTSNNHSPKPQVQILTNSNTDSAISSSNGKQYISSTQSTYKSNSIPYSTKNPSTTPTTLRTSKILSQQPLLPTVQSKFQPSVQYFPSSTAATTLNIQQKAPIFSSTHRPISPTQQTSVTILQPSTDSTNFADEFSFASTSNMPLTDLFKKRGLFAMAKFLKQSGLDTILNETGPYTIFVPTDKAFRNLLIQLGGPEKAEEKFKENPRLLSGLLLHHVIPGAFEIKHLQDEMTGVSLAGTQLRVNQYAMQDVEWNEVKVTTINGAKIMEDKQDISIPQGIAHSVDRVMFPLPVGDIVQTLQSDRERRFTTFLRILFASGLADTLQGTKTYTVFAPVDRAFTSLTPDVITNLVTDKTAAREFIMRHIIPGTLYTTGMRYYQIKDSLQADKQITINKTTGRLKVNNVNIITQNVPTTNGVVHAMESML